MDKRTKIKKDKRTKEKKKKGKRQKEKNKKRTNVQQMNKWTKTKGQREQHIHKLKLKYIFKVLC